MQNAMESKKTISWKMFENKLKNFSFTCAMFTQFICKKLTEEKNYKCEVLVYEQFRNVREKSLSLFLSHMLSVRC